MHTSTLPFLLILLFVGICLVHATRVSFHNSCDFRVEVICTEDGRPSRHEVSLSPDKCSGADFGDSENGRSGKTIAEFNFNTWFGLDVYGLSVIDGYDTPMQISSDRGRTVTCRESRCPDAYQYPTDYHKNQSVKTGGTFTITFCP